MTLLFGYVVMSSTYSMRHHNLQIVMSHTIIVRKGVFCPDPKETNSTTMMLNNLPDIKQKDVLDMGCGTGIIGIYCVLNGARRVVAVDINEKAIENAKENVERNKIGHIVKVIKSDLFENVEGSFDCIFGNLPINDEAWNLEIPTAELMKKFLSECGGHIRKDGIVYFTWNSGADVVQIRDFLAVKGCRFEEVRENKAGTTWYLFKLHF